MKPNHARRRTGAFTGWDLLVVIVTVVLAGLMLPVLARPRAAQCRIRINCVSNLKQVGLAFRMWSNDNGEKFPWQVSTNNGGTLELTSSGDAFPHFLAISNEANIPKIFVCPEDPARTRVVAWDQFVSDSNLSYFVGLDASEAFPQTILSGDRNLNTNGYLLSGLVLLMTNASLQWTAGLHAPGGNVGFADGSAAEMTAKGARAQRAMDTNSTIRLVFP